MIKRIIHLSIAIIISVMTTGASLAQTTSSSSASATEVTVTSSTPSSYTIRANILAQKKAAIQAQIDIAAKVYHDEQQEYDSCETPRETPVRSQKLTSPTAPGG